MNLRAHLATRSFVLGWGFLHALEIEEDYAKWVS